MRRVVGTAGGLDPLTLVALGRVSLSGGATGDAWAAHTEYVVDDGQPILIVAWLGADKLRPA